MIRLLKISRSRSHKDQTFKSLFAHYESSGASTPFRFRGKVHHSFKSVGVLGRFSLRGKLTAIDGLIKQRNGQEISGSWKIESVNEHGELFIKFIAFERPLLSTAISKILV